MGRDGSLGAPAGVGVIELNDVLRKAGIDPATTLVVRHRPTAPELRKALAWFAADEPEVYNAYQCYHGERVERALVRATHLVSLIGHRPAQALFVGIYEVGGWAETSGAEWRALETSRTLMELGDRGARDGPILVFDLVCTDLLAPWKGKLVVDWPPPERSWWRWAARNKMLVSAIHDESVLVPRMVAWNELVLTWAQLGALPRSWQTALAQWRGIYLILDRASGRSYVGSAYGAENLFSRWVAYASSGHGGNADLKGRDPTNFTFSILQLVAPDLPADAVIHLEGTWKDRLGTREFGLNKN